MKRICCTRGSLALGVGHFYMSHIHRQLGVYSQTLVILEYSHSTRE